MSQHLLLEAACSARQAKEGMSWKQLSSAPRAPKLASDSHSRGQSKPLPLLGAAGGSRGHALCWAGADEALGKQWEAVGTQPLRRAPVSVDGFPSKQQLSRPYDAAKSWHFLTSDRDYKTNV